MLKKHYGSCIKFNNTTYLIEDIKDDKYFIINLINPNISQVLTINEISNCESIKPSEIENEMIKTIVLKTWKNCNK